MNKPLVSVIVPCYNQASFLGDALESVITQTYDNWECIIVNDGSTDNTEAVANRFMDKDQRIKYYFQENQGLAAARNRGYSPSKGSYIQFLDADDMIAPNKIEEQVSLMETDKGVDVCFSNYLTFETSPEIPTGLYSEPILSEVPLEDFLFRWERGLCIPIHTALIKRKIFNEGLPFHSELRAKEDWVLWVTISLKGGRFKFIDKYFAFYRMHELQMTRNIVFMAEYFLEAFTVILKQLSIGTDLVNRFIEESIEHFKAYSILPNYVSNLFYDSGKGFNSDECLKSELIIKNDNFNVKFQINKGIKPLALRFDPIENHFIALTIQEVLTDGFYNGISGSNASKNLVEWDYFYTNDPMYYLDGDFSNTTWLNIKGQIRLLNNSEITQEIEKKNQEIEKKNQEIEKMLNSKSWKITAPLRFLTNTFKQYI